MHRIERLGAQLGGVRRGGGVGISASVTSAHGLDAQQLKGKCCVVTGAGSGIGAATAMLFARHGANVVCADIDEESAKESAQDINQDFPGCAIHLKCDVSNKADTKNVVDLCVSKFGRLDVFFANAGVLNKFVPIINESEEQFMKVLSINTLSVFMAIKYAGEAMKKSGGGSIICTGSIAALRADLTPLQYTASKGAVLSMVRSANDRMLLDNVRVNAVVPGGVLTPLVMRVAQNLHAENLELKGYDSMRFPPIDPAEIAQVVVFLASDQSQCIKGQQIIADGAMANSMGSQPYPTKKK
uniref:Uncharacterized protein n=1 Tax=Mucochytrium quahogii TaxID=96639 RepID=A0A7S2S5Q5_9STRA|mmetsp:Transcript_11841/g.19287  ORF Transcript_11841/g.19287 Transcript_11841/m.19287 type:complete len:299 (+) Transcript_11841:57-953(+)|eukprot:CAMPEP_0203744964 /NCGR_PEP_ID=MMETSP0098-20131031/855_1 /ASSEMBLY_ACC=CAM_ASM_000208 /TAXON_ID=96639 /ORGANISM=" , Strain NY0313808BC1" /LENGTH=298 /DNA_ID=CAMNT_0050632617 /DNA_START=65 /DNA_END=961 /DNA_ORIENTATION=+